MALYQAEPRPPALTAALDQVKGERPGPGQVHRGRQERPGAPGDPGDGRDLGPVRQGGGRRHRRRRPGQDRSPPPARRSPVRSSNEHVAVRPGVRHAGPGPGARPLRAPAQRPVPRATTRRSPRPASSSRWSCSAWWPGSRSGRPSRSSRPRLWVGLAVLVATTAGLFYLYLTRRHIPAKYLVPGTLFLIAFQVFPVLYTASTAFTNFGDGHRGSKDDAIVAIQTSSVKQVPGSDRVRPRPSPPRATRPPARWSSWSPTRRPARSPPATPAGCASSTPPT